jgi:hypothetical protein
MHCLIDLAVCSVYFVPQGHQQSRAPAIGRKVLLSVSNGHPQNNLDNILHPSQLQAPGFQSLGL